MHEITEKFKIWWTEHLIKNPVLYFVLALLMCAVTAPGILKITSDFSYKMWYNESDPMMTAYHDFEKKFGNDDNAILAIYDEKGIFNRKTLEIMQSLTKKMWEVDHIARVDSIINYDSIRSENDEISVTPFFQKKIKDYTDAEIEELKEKALKDKNLMGYLVSNDLKAAFVTGQLRPAFEDVPNYYDIHLTIKKIADKYKKKHPSIEYLQVGSVSINYALTDITFTDMKILLPMLFGMFILTLFIIYKNFWGIFLPFTIIGTSVWQMFGVMGFLGHKFNAISSASPTVLTTVCLADAIHLLTSFYLSRKHGNSTEESLRYAVGKNLYPTLLTSVTTLLGFWSFSDTKVIPIGNFGIEVAFGVAFAFFNTYFLIVPILTWLGRKEKLNAKTDMDRIEKSEEKHESSPFVKKITSHIIKFAWPITIISLLVTGGSFYFASKLEVNMDPLQQFSDEYFLKKNMLILERHFGGYVSVEIDIDAGKEDGAKDPKFLRKVEKFEDWLLDQPYMHKTISIVGIIKRLNQTLHNGDEKYYVIPDTQEEVSQELFFYTLGLAPGREINNRITLNNDHIRLTGMWDVHSSKNANRLIKEINEQAIKMDLKAKITGKMPLFHDLTPYVVSTFNESFLQTLLTILIVLSIVLTSLKLGLLAMVPNVFPVVLGMAVYYLMGFDLDMATVIVADVALGIAVDDSTHFLFEFRRRRREGKPIQNALESIATNTYPALIFTTVINCAGFGTFFLADYIPNAKFGIMVSLILGVALFADFYIMPALLYLSERKNKKSPG